LLSVCNPLSISQNDPLLLRASNLEGKVEEKNRSAVHFGRVQKLLYECGLTNLDGSPVKALESLKLPPLTDKEKSKLTDLLKQKIIVDDESRGLKLSVSISELLLSLDKQYPIKSLEIFGSAVLKTLGSGYITRCLECALSHVGGSQDWLGELSAIDVGTALSDVDVRVQFKTQLENIPQLATEFIIAELAEKNELSNQPEKLKGALVGCGKSLRGVRPEKLHLEAVKLAFNKLRFPKPEDKNRFAIWALGMFDVLHVHKFERAWGIHTTGSLSIDLYEAVKNNYKKEIRPESGLMNGWLGLFDLLQAIMRPSDKCLEEDNWTKSLVGYVRGYSHFDKASYSVFPAVKDVPGLIRKAHLNHFRQEAAAGTALVIQALEILHERADEADLRIIVQKCTSVWNKGPETLVKKLRSFTEEECRIDQLFLELKLFEPKQFVYDNLCSPHQSVKIQCGEIFFINLRWDCLQIMPLLDRLELPPIERHVHMPVDFPVKDLREKGLYLIDKGDSKGLNLYLLSRCFEERVSIDSDFVKRLPKLIGTDEINQAAGFFEINEKLDHIDNTLTLIESFCHAADKRLKEAAALLIKEEMNEYCDDRTLSILCEFALKISASVGLKAFIKAAGRISAKMRIKLFLRIAESTKVSGLPPKQLARACHIALLDSVDGFVPENLERLLLSIVEYLSEAGCTEDAEKALFLIGYNLSFKNGIHIMDPLYHYCQNLKERCPLECYGLWEALQDKDLWKNQRKSSDYRIFLAGLAYQLYCNNETAAAERVLAVLVPTIPRPPDSKLAVILRKIGKRQSALLDEIWDEHRANFGQKLREMQNYLCIGKSGKKGLKLKLIENWLEEGKSDEAVNALQKFQFCEGREVFETLCLVINTLIDQNRQNIALDLLDKMKALDYSDCFPLILRCLESGWGQIERARLFQIVQKIVERDDAQYTARCASLTINYLSEQSPQNRLPDDVIKMIGNIFLRLMKDLREGPFFEILRKCQVFNLPVPESHLARSLKITENQVENDPSALAVAGFLLKQKCVHSKPLKDSRTRLIITLFNYHCARNHWHEALERLHQVADHVDKKRIIAFFKKLSICDYSPNPKQIQSMAETAIGIKYYDADFWIDLVEQAAASENNLVRRVVCEVALKGSVPASVDPEVEPVFYENLYCLVSHLTFEQFTDYLSYFIDMLISAPLNDQLLNARSMFLNKCWKERDRLSPEKWNELKSNVLLYDPFLDLCREHPLFKKTCLTIAQIYLSGEHDLPDFKVAISFILAVFYPDNDQGLEMGVKKDFEPLFLLFKSSHYNKYFIPNASLSNNKDFLMINEIAKCNELPVHLLETMVKRNCEVFEKNIHIQFDQVASIFRLVEKLLIATREAPAKIDMDLSYSIVFPLYQAVGLSEEGLLFDEFNRVINELVQQRHIRRLFPVHVDKVDARQKEHYLRAVILLNYLSRRCGPSALNDIENLIGKIEELNVIPLQAILTSKLSFYSCKLQTISQKSNEHAACIKKIYNLYIDNYETLLEVHRHLERDIDYIADMFFSRKNVKDFERFLKVIYQSLDKDSGIQGALLLLRAIFNHAKTIAFFSGSQNSSIMALIKKILLKIVESKTNQPEKILSALIGYCTLILTHYKDVEQSYKEWQFWVEKVRSNEDFRQCPNEYYSFLSQCFAAEKFDIEVHAERLCRQLIVNNSLCNDNVVFYNAFVDLLQLGAQRKMLKNTLGKGYSQMLGCVKRFFNRELGIDKCSIANHAVICQFTIDLGTIMKLMGSKKGKCVLKDLINMNLELMPTSEIVLLNDGKEWRFELPGSSARLISPHYMTLQLELFKTLLYASDQSDYYECMNNFISFADYLFDPEFNAAIKNFDSKNSADRLWLAHIEEGIIKFFTDGGRSLTDSNKKVTSEAAISVLKKIFSVARSNTPLRLFFKKILSGIESVILPDEQKSLEVLRNLSL
jgi:hypothetical protein